MTPATITLHLDAPSKPPAGAPCNGCGVCCAAQPCPTAMLLFWQIRGACRALRWDDAQRRYQCGLLIAPREFLPWLPQRGLPHATQFFYRRIAAGKGCDCTIETETIEV